MILELDIDNLSVAQRITAEEMLKRMLLSEEEAIDLISNTILTLGLAIASQACEFGYDLKEQQLFILAVTSAANKIVTESYEDFENDEFKDDSSEDDEYYDGR